MTRLTKPSSLGMTVLKMTRPAVVSTSSLCISPAPSLAAASQISSSTLIGAWTWTWLSWADHHRLVGGREGLAGPFSFGSSMVR